jgi:hypothetical protein
MIYGLVAFALPRFAWAGESCARESMVWMSGVRLVALGVWQLCVVTSAQVSRQITHLTRLTWHGCIVSSVVGRGGMRSPLCLMGLLTAVVCNPFGVVT